MTIFPQKSILEILESIAKIVGVCVAIWGIWSYFDELHRKSIEKSISFNDDFFLGPASVARGALDKRLLDLVSTIDKRSERSKKDFDADKELKKVFVAEYGNALLLIGFFDRLADCVKIGSCDERSASDLFKERAQYYMGFFKVFIVDKRAESNGFADGLEFISSLE